MLSAYIHITPICNTDGIHQHTHTHNTCPKNDFTLSLWWWRMFSLHSTRLNTTHTHTHARAYIQLHTQSMTTYIYGTKTKTTHYARWKKKKKMVDDRKEKYRRIFSALSLSKTDSLFLINNFVPSRPQFIRFTSFALFTYTQNHQTIVQHSLFEQFRGYMRINILRVHNSNNLAILTNISKYSRQTDREAESEIGINFFFLFSWCFVDLGLSFKCRLTQAYDAYSLVCHTIQ